ncbi:diaminopimelate epimerase [bacterium]|nr:diaminopimelate epimerase [bacterium]
MSGTGNDFIIFDNRPGAVKAGNGDFFRSICRRRLSVGADGVILLETGSAAPVRMRYFNSDGNEAEMCGNGARCAAWLARRLAFVHQDRFVIETAAGLHQAAVEGDDVSIEMTAPADYRDRIEIPGLPDSGTAAAINTGVPHLALFRERIDDLDVPALGRPLRYSSLFPGGVNVNFVSVVDSGTIRVRTYERGVEAETLSCGTGCVASALIASRLKGVSSPVSVLTPGGELTVEFDPQWRQVLLRGAVTLVFSGRLGPSAPSP